MYSAFLPIERKYTFFRETGSTNTDIKNRIRESRGPVFEVISAQIQSSGRGRLGRSFFSPDGGIYFSASFPLCSKEKNPAFLSLIGGLAAALTVERLCGANVEIKWPNDLYLNGKKLAGILTELVSEKNTAVLGIGINSALKKEDIPDHLSGKMTSLAAEGSVIPETDEVIREIVDFCDREIYLNGALLGDGKKYTDIINGRSFLKGKETTVTVNGEKITGEAKCVAPDGSLVIADADGKLRYISCGEAVCG